MFQPTENSDRHATLQARIAELEGQVEALSQRESAYIREKGELLKEMQDARKRYLAIIESFDGQIYICSQDYRIEFMNLAFVQRAGRSGVGELCYRVLHGLDDICPWCVNERVFRGETVRWEVQSPKDGHWFYIVNTPIFNEDGTVSKHALIQDITERKLAEEKQRSSEEKFRGIFANAPVGIYQTGLDGRIISINPMLAAMIGYDSPEAMLAETESATSFFVDPNLRKRIVRSALESERFVQCEVDYRRRNGTVLTSLLSMRVERDGEGEVKFLEGFVEDISLRKRAEEELRKLSEVVKQSPISIVITDADGVVEFVNPNFTRTSGFEPPEVIGKFAPILVPEALGPQEDPQALWRTISSGKVWEGECRSRKKSGELIWERVNLSAIRSADGAIAHYVALMQDITEQKTTKEQLLQSQKMEAVGQLAGGIAHDFNNILTAIVGFGSILQLGLPEHDPLQSSVTQVISAAERAASLTQSLLAFSRNHIVNLQPVDLNQAIRNVEKFLRRIIIEEISFRTSFSEESPTVQADSGQIQQVLMNLVTNARDAMPKGGVLTIETGGRKVDEQFVALHGCGAPGCYATVSVSDTGAGMDEETRKKIFEPFFTTKEVGKGTGLGLSIVYGIVKQHNGFITTQSTPGQGTTFTIFIPAVSSDCAGKREIAEGGAARGGTETILVAEDDNAVRALMGNILRSYGYRVILTKDGKEALGKFREHQDDIHLVLLDMIMPRMNGKEVYRQVREMRPDVKALFFSGYTTDFIRDRGELDEGARLIAKPVQPLELLRKVREMLDD